MIKQQIVADQIQAMKSKDSQTLETLRYILAQIKNLEIDKKEELTDEDATQVLRKEAKKLQDSISSFEKGGRADLAAEYKIQLDIISKYLPVEASDEDIKKDIQLIIEKNKEMFAANPNALIGICVKELKAKADPGRIAQIVRDLQ